MSFRAQMLVVALGMVAIFAGIMWRINTLPDPAGTFDGVIVYMVHPTLRHCDNGEDYGKEALVQMTFPANASIRAYGSDGKLHPYPSGGVVFGRVSREYNAERFVTDHADGKPWHLKYDRAVRLCTEEDPTERIVLDNLRLDR